MFEAKYFLFFSSLPHHIRVLRHFLPSARWKIRSFFTNLVWERRKKINKIFCFEQTIKNIVIVPETQGERPGVKTEACSFARLGFRCSRNGSKITKFLGLSSNSVLCCKQEQRVLTLRVMYAQLNAHSRRYEAPESNRINCNLLMVSLSSMNAYLIPCARSTSSFFIICHGF